MCNFSKKENRKRNHYDLTSGIFARAVRHSAAMHRYLRVDIYVYLRNQYVVGRVHHGGWRLHADCIYNAQSESAEAKACIICVSVCIQRRYTDPPIHGVRR